MISWTTLIEANIYQISSVDIGSNQYFQKAQLSVGSTNWYNICLAFCRHALCVVFAKYYLAWQGVVYHSEIEYPGRNNAVVTVCKRLTGRAATLRDCHNFYWTWLTFSEACQFNLKVLWCLTHHVMKRLMYLGKGQKLNCFKLRQ